MIVFWLLVVVAAAVPIFVEWKIKPEGSVFAGLKYQYRENKSLVQLVALCALAVIFLPEVFLVLPQSIRPVFLACIVAAIWYAYSMLKPKLRL